MSDISVFTSDEYLDKDYFLSEDINSNDSSGKTEKKIKIIKVIFVMLCLVLVGEFVYYKVIMPGFSIPKITVSGQQKFSAQEIGQMILPMCNDNWHTFDVEKANALISSDPEIESVVVEKKFPDKVFISIVEREPVALTFVTIKNDTVAMQIDKNGVIFEGKKGINVDSNKIPIISGLPIEYLAQGMRIPSKYRPLIDQITKISELPQSYFAGISEICVHPKEFGNYELALIPSQSHIKVLTDRSLNEEALKYMMVVLDVVKQLGSDVSEIDLRYGSVSYRTKNQVKNDEIILKN